VSCESKKIGEEFPYLIELSEENGS